MKNKVTEIRLQCYDREIWNRERSSVSHENLITATSSRKPNLHSGNQIVA